MTTRKKIIIGILAAIGLWIAYGLVDFFVYPLSSGSKPTFKDVEQTFDKIPVPDGWTEIRSSENPGISFGRYCWIENETTCFHKSKTYKVIEDQKYDIRSLLVESTNCIVTEYEEPSEQSGKDYYSIRCILPDNIEIKSSFGGAKHEVYIGVVGTPSEE